jgi:hypothetical protein
VGRDERRYGTEFVFGAFVGIPHSHVKEEEEKGTVYGEAKQIFFHRLLR